MRIGFQVSSIREYVATPEGVMQSFTRVREIGYDNVQVQYLGPEVPADDVKRALDASGLECIGTQDDYPDSLARIGDIVGKNLLWGGKYVCSACWPENAYDESGRVRFAAEMAAAGTVVEDAGLTFTYHPLWPDLVERDGLTPLDYLLEHARTNLQVTLDLYHVSRAGLDPVQTLHRYAGRMDVVHFKDGRRTPEGKSVLTPIGQGDIDWEPIVRACLSCGVKYCYLEQEHWDKDAFVCMAESLSYVSAILGRLAAV